jgi:tRNA-dihydrouridine synthase B
MASACAASSAGDPLVRRIGSFVVPHPFVLAPMRRITTPAYRVWCEIGGAALTFTECIPAGLLRERGCSWRRAVARHPQEQRVGAQISALNGQEAADATRILLEAGFGLIDVNFGCPPRSREDTRGVALMREPRRVHDIVHGAVRAAQDVPVTAKIRAGYDESDRNAVTVARAAVDAGAAAVIVHGRFGVQGYRGRASWDVVAEVKAAVAVPVIGNGDVRTPEEAVHRLRESGCDLVMIGRGSYARPSIFSQARDLLAGRTAPSPASRSTLKELGHYLALAVQGRDWPEGTLEALYRYRSVVRPPPLTAEPGRAGPLGGGLPDRAVVAWRRTRAIVR